MNRLIKENLVKNAVLIILLSLSYPVINDYLINSNLVEDTASAGDVLVSTSITAVIACFGAFAFTYEKINAKERSQAYLAHITTGTLMLVIGISLIFTHILTTFIMGSFILLDLTLFLLYFGVVGYDFWDLLRLTNN